MLTRILLLLVTLAVAANTGNSQPVAEFSPPEPCRAITTEPLSALQKRKERLEKALARTGEPAGKPAVDEAKAKTLGKSQADLLEVLFQIDCLKRELSKSDASKVTLVGAAPPPPPSPSPPEAAPSPSAPEAASRQRSIRKLSGDRGADGNVVEVTTYFATNRGRTGKAEPANAYDASVAALSYGRALVTIPSSHTPGSLELPSIWRLQFQPDPARHFILKDVASLSTDAVRLEMAKKLEESKSKALMIFVHGYNMSFAETAMRTAQLAHDLNFPGVPFFFSWPSAGQITGYLRDVESAQLSEDAFDQVLDELSQFSPATDIYVVAHSMGSRVVSQVLRSRVDKGKPTARLSELLLAAPDINADLFRTVIAPRLKALPGLQTTVYASSSDLALMASKAVHGYQRVGDTAGSIFVYPGLETIDASRASMAVRAFGHSYLTDSAAVLGDIRSILREKLKAKQRGLSPSGASPNEYWTLR